MARESVEHTERPTCPRCGSLTPPNKKGGGRWTMYCSPRCRSSHNSMRKRERAAVKVGPPCVVRGCVAVQQGGVAGGLCSRHYQYRQRTGVAASKAEMRQWFFEDLIASPTNECVIWPFSRDRYGYGMHSIGRSVRVRAHRHALSLLTGIDPPDKLACHGPCNNPLCVNPHPDHGMYWGTRADNVADMVRDGTVVRGEAVVVSVLTEQAAREAHARYARGDVVARIAADLGVSSSTVIEVARGNNWRHLGLAPLPLRIRSTRRRGVPEQPIRPG